jgi:glutathione S-transferase
MDRIRLFGLERSAYTRIARLALEEKQASYERVPVDIFAQGGPPDWYRARQPFGRIPAFEHDGFQLYETSAIARYVDEAFVGPPLQPAGVRERGRMNQIIGILDGYAYRTMVWDIYVERVSKPREGGIADEDRIRAAIPVARTCLAALAEIKGEGPWFSGQSLSLADLHAAPIFAYFLKSPEGHSMIGEQPGLSAWWDAISRRSSFAATEPAE